MIDEFKIRVHSMIRVKPLTPSTTVLSIPFEKFKPIDWRNFPRKRKKKIKKQMLKINEIIEGIENDQ